MSHLFEQNNYWFHACWTCYSFVVFWNFRGFGFVTFVDADSVEKVLDASPHHLDSKQVTNWFVQISLVWQIWTEFQLGNLLCLLRNTRGNTVGCKLLSLCWDGVCVKISLWLCKGLSWQIIFGHGYLMFWQWKDELILIYWISCICCLYRLIQN